MNNEPPRRLSNDPTHPDFHPSLLRVGLRINGVERTDIARYDVDNLRYWTIGMKTTEAPTLATSIEPYWRFDESRQMRRARERWERDHGH